MSGDYLSRVLSGRDPRPVVVSMICTIGSHAACDEARRLSVGSLPCSCKCHTED